MVKSVTKKLLAISFFHPSLRQAAARLHPFSCSLLPTPYSLLPLYKSRIFDEITEFLSTLNQTKVIIAMS
jgi:hypothetical protein